jgi:hypothetical protein
MKVNIPANCSALIAIPQVNPDKITESNKPIRELKDAIRIYESAGKTMCEIPSGEYLFKIQYVK